MKPLRFLLCASLMLVLGSVAAARSTAQVPKTEIVGLDADFKSVAYAAPVTVNLIVYQIIPECKYVIAYENAEPLTISVMRPGGGTINTVSYCSASFIHASLLPPIRPPIYLDCIKQC